MPWPKSHKLWDDPANVERLVARWKAGVSQTQLAIEFDCSRTAIQSELGRLGIRSRTDPTFTISPVTRVVPFPQGVKKTLPPLPSLMGVDVETG